MTRFPTLSPGLAGVLAIGLATLACGPMSSPPTPPAPPPVPAAQNEPAPVAAPAAPVGSGSASSAFFVNPKGIFGGRSPGVSPQNVDASGRYKGMYVVKMSDGADAETDIDTDGRVRNKRLQGRFDKAKMKKGRRVHAKGSTHEAGGTLAFESDANPDAVAQAMAGDDVEWIEAVTHLQALGAPNDEYFQYQWDLEAARIGKVHSMTTGVGVTVAVVDSGVSEGPDGFLHLLKGHDFVDDDDDASDPEAVHAGHLSHGTHVAGTIAQTTGNGKGVAGIAPGVSILPVRVLSSAGGSSIDVAAGIVWAVDHGADVINMSLGGSTTAKVISEACAYAKRHDVVVVAASGNDGHTDQISFPASLPSVIAVGATDFAGKEAPYSNRSAKVDILAPGGDTTADLNRDGQPDGILQETLNGGIWGYAMLQGTSMASPHVAAAAALLKAVGVRDPERIREILTATAENVGRPYGLLNIRDAVEKAQATAGRGEREGGKDANRSRGGRNDEGAGGGRKAARARNR